MLLKEYLKSKNITINQLARHLNYSPGHISRVVNRTMNPCEFLAASILQITKGEVSLKELKIEDKEYHHQ